MGGVLTVRVVRLQRILPPTTTPSLPQRLQREAGDEPGDPSAGSAGWAGRPPRGGCRTAAAEEGRYDGQHPTFLIANRDGPGRRLDGRLLHEGAGDRHGGGSGGDSRNLRNPKK